MPFCNGFGPPSWQRRKKQSEAVALLDDAALAAELNELSVQEREHIYEVVHGVANIRMDESPELISSKMKELHQAIAEIPKRRRKDYERALFLKPSLEKDVKFHLMFLRADGFDCPKAAQRICRYFTNKRELFGDDKLAKRLTLDDLDEDDMEALRSGSQRVLDKTDTSGRRVWVSNFSRLRFKNRVNDARQVWYTIMSDYEMDETSLRDGTVVVSYCVGMDMEDATKMIETLAQAGRLVMDLPNRFTGLHFCYDSPAIRSAMSVFQMLVGKKNRFHFRPHHGSETEVIYSLLSFGIILDRRLVSDSEKDRDSVFEEYVSKRRRIEEAWKQEELELLKEGKVICPSPKDVLLGRGRPFQDFSGNTLMGTYIDEKYEEYQSLKSKMKKTEFSMNIVKKIQADGGRFLTRRADHWEITPDLLARRKVSQGIRMRARAMESSPPIDNSSCSAEQDDESSTDCGPNSSKKIRYDESVVQPDENLSLVATASSSP